MKKILIIIGILVAHFANSQEPAYVPSSKTYWYQGDYIQGLKGVITGIRDTAWTPRFGGTSVFWQHAGVDSVYWYYNGSIWKKSTDIPTPCPVYWGDLFGKITDQLDLDSALATKELYINPKNIADTTPYYWNGYKEWGNLYDNVRFGMKVSYDSSSEYMTFTSPDNLYHSNRNIDNMDTTGIYAGVYSYNSSTIGVKPSSTGSGVVYIYWINNDNKIDNVNNGTYLALNRSDNSIYTRTFSLGTGMSAWKKVMDSATIADAYLKLTGGDINGLVGFKNKADTPIVTAETVALRSDNSGNLRWWYSNGQYIKWDTTGMNGGNLNIAMASITQQGNTFNGASQLVKMTASAKLPAADASLLTLINPTAGISIGSGTAGQSLRVNTGATALEWYTPSGATGTTVGNNILNLTNPSAVTFIRINADNTVSSRTASQYRTDIGLTTIGERLATVADQGAVSYLRVNADNTLSWRTAAQYLSDIGGDVATNLTSGTLPAGRLPAHTGDVTSSAGSAALTIASGAVTQAKTANYSAYTMWANNTASATTASSVSYQQTAKQPYSGTFTWDGTAPSGSLQTYYQWAQVGKLVTVSFWSGYATAGTTNTSLDLTWPSDLPVPEEPSGRTSNNDIVASGYANVGTGTTNKPNTVKGCYIIRTGSSTYKFNLSFGSISAKTADFSISYFVP